MDDDFKPADASAPLRLEQRGRAGELLPIVLPNTLLNILTLSIYRFWGKTRVRRYLWRQTHFMGEPLEYTGTGSELFKGFLVVFFLILVPLGVISSVADLYLEPEGLALIIFSVVFYIGIYFLIGLAIYRARRYRLSRTVWRGIRGSMIGSSGQYAIRYLTFSALALVTLGWAYPWMRLKLFKRIMEESAFGDRAFRFEASSGPLYRVFAILWIGSVLALFSLFLLSGGLELVIAAREAHGSVAISTWQIVLLGISPVAIWLAMAWYKAREINLIANGTSFEGLSFRMDASAWNLIGLVSVNGLILVLTLGFGQPFAQLRVFRYFCRRISIEGTLDVADILQSSALVPSLGEGLADAFDLGAV